MYHIDTIIYIQIKGATSMLNKNEIKICIFCANQGDGFNHIIEEHEEFLITVDDFIQMCTIKSDVDYIKNNKRITVTGT